MRPFTVAVRPLIPCLALLAALYAYGIGWGLPSMERAARVFSPEQLNDSFYRALEENRKSHYARVGWNLQAAYGRGAWSGSLLPPTEGFQMIRYPASPSPEGILMHAYSSFMMRSVEQDEQFVLNTLSRFNPRRLDFNPHQSLYGGAYIYPLAGFFAFLHAAGRLNLVADPLYYYRNPEELAKLYKAGRIFSLLSSLGCVVLVFEIARRLYDERCALWAALLFGLAPGVIAYSHVMKPHLPAAFWALSCLLGCVQARLAGGLRPLLGASVCFGLAVGSAKYFWVLSIPLATAFFLSVKDPWAPRRWLALAGLNLVAVGVFFLVNPYVLVSWGDFAAEMKGMAGWYRSSIDPAAVWSLAVHPLRLGLGTGSWLLALAGTAYAMRRRSLLPALAAPMAVLTAFQMSSGAEAPHTFRAIFPAAALLLIPGVALALRGLPGRHGPRLATAALWVICVLNTAQGLLYGANFAADRPGRSNSFAAGRWIEDNVPAGESLGFGTPAPMLDRFPPLPFSRYAMTYVKGPLDGQNMELPKYYVTNLLWIGGLDESFHRRYRLARAFDAPSWNGRVFRDPFTSANFPVAVFVRKR